MILLGGMVYLGEIAALLKGIAASLKEKRKTEDKSKDDGSK